MANQIDCTDDKKRVLCSSSQRDACRERAEHLRVSLWADRSPGQWPSWSALAQGCKSYLDETSQILTLAAASFEAIENDCSLRAQQEITKTRGRLAKTKGSSDLIYIFNFLQSLSKARRPEFWLKNQKDSPKIIMRQSRDDFYSILKNTDDEQKQCESARCVDNFKFMRSYACLYVSKIDFPDIMPLVEIQKTEACAIAQIRGMNQGLGKAKLMAMIHALLFPPAADVDDTTTGIERIQLHGDALQQLAKLLHQIRSAKKDGSRQEEARRLLQYARVLIAQHRVGIARHESAGRSWLGETVDEIFDLSFDDALSDKLLLNGAKADNSMPLRLITTSEDRRRFDIVRFFQSDCGFSRAYSHQRDGNPAAAFSVAGTWIVLIFRTRSRIVTTVFTASDQLSSATAQPAKTHIVELESVEPLVKEWQRATSNMEPLEKPSKEARRLLQILLGDIPREIGSFAPARIIIVPDSWAARIPFAALPLKENGDSLVRVADIVMMPSLDRGPWPINRSQIAELSTSPRILAGAFPDAAMEREVNRLPQFFPNSTIITGQDFGLDALLREGSRNAFDILHLSTHASFNIESGADIVFQNGPSGNASDLDRLVNTMVRQEKPTLSLLTLSACQTGVGTEGRVGVEADGNELGLLGMALRTGAQASVGTLWKVDSEATELLFSTFYSSLKVGCDKARALRKAQVAVSKRSEWSHPYYWAGFVMSGDWSPLTASSVSCPVP